MTTSNKQPPTETTSLKAAFVKLCIANGVLRFGSFTLKSGRISPYFFNAGRFNRGPLLGEIAQYYAALIAARTEGEFMLFGPAYKGIPLAAATALKLADDHNLDVGYAFNRKEAKDHGEGGALVGASLRCPVVIVDDVITAGTSIGESVRAIAAGGGVPHSVAVALDRQEIADERGLSAAQRIEQTHGIAVHSIVNLNDLVDWLEGDDAEQAMAVRDYRDRYGVV